MIMLIGTYQISNSNHKNIFTVTDTKTNKLVPFCSSCLPGNHGTIVLNQVGEAAKAKRRSLTSTPAPEAVEPSSSDSRFVSLHDIKFAQPEKY